MVDGILFQFKGYTKLLKCGFDTFKLSAKFGVCLLFAIGSKQLAKLLLMSGDKRRFWAIRCGWGGEVE